MAYPQTADVIPVPIPVKGMNTRDPLALMDPNYAPWILNYEPEPQYLRATCGFTRAAAITSLFGTAMDRIYSLASYNNTYLLFLCGNAAAPIISMGDIDGFMGANVFSWPTMTMPSVVTPVHYAGRSGFIAPDATSFNNVICDGTSTITAHSFTINGSFIYSRTLTTYRGRVYLSSGRELYYSDLAGITGPCTKIDCTQLFRSNTAIAWICALTSPTNAISESMIAFGNGMGEVLVYTGDNPGSPDWRQVARFQLPRPLYYNMSWEHDNDVWIATVSGIYSLRALFEFGTEIRERVTVSSAIDPYYTRLVRACSSDTALINTSFAHWPEQNKVFILIAGALDADGTFQANKGTLLIYNTISKAWTIRQIGSIDPTNKCHSLTYYKNAIYYATGKYIMKYAEGVYKDQTWNDTTYAAIPYAIHSAYTDLDNAKKTKQVVCIEPVMKTDFTGSSVTAKVAADFGRKTSTATSQALQDGYQVPTYMTGVSGRHIQYRIEGNTDQTSTDGLELYSMGVGIK